MSVEFKVTPIHPFTKTQAEILEMRANGVSNKEIARMRGTAWQTIRHHISGNGTDTKMAGRGILGIIEDATNERCSSRFIFPLIGDILTVTIEGVNHIGKPCIVANNPFSNTQVEILKGILKGYTNKEIATKLGINTKTVNKFISVNHDSMYSIVNEITGRRPLNTTDLVLSLYESNILVSNTEPLPNPDHDSYDY